MTWSIVQSFTTQAASYNKTDLEPPHVYFFETFLPTRGWSVTPGETGGGGFSSTVEGMWGLSKAFTFADGTTLTRNLIIELEYGSSDVVVYGWTGVPGEGRGSSLASDQGWDGGLKIGLNNFHILASDENPDSWCMFGGKKLIYWSHPSTGMYQTSVTDAERFRALGMIACMEGASSGMGYPVSAVNYGTMYHGHANSFSASAYLMTPAFSFFYNSQGADAFGQNASPDTYSRFTNTIAAYSAIGSINPSSVLIDGDYYLDLLPSNVGSIMLKTGATDLGVLS